MAISNELLSSTLFSIRDGEVDELFQRVPFLDFAKKMGGIEYLDGGIKIQRPMAVSQHSSITQLATGYEPVSLAVQDVMQPALYEWADFVAPIVITKKEELENSGEKAIVKIVEARMRNVMGILRREINKQLVAGNSAVLTQLLSLNGDPASGITTGFLQQGLPAAATQANTVGGLARSLVPDGYGLFNRSFACAGATPFSTDGIRGMQQLAAETSARAPMGEIKLILASEAGYANYRRALFNQERYIDEKQLNAGYMSLAFGNAAVCQDVFFPKTADMDTGVPSTMFFINFDGIKLVMHSDGDLAVSPFEYIPGTTARSAQIYWKGQLIADNLASCAVLTNGETY